jgi:hypothetical protein
MGWDRNIDSEVESEPFVVEHSLKEERGKNQNNKNVRVKED